ncbi:MAG: hypothetical protein AAB215_01280 [Planctomycetota bacterium]
MPTLSDRLAAIGFRVSTAGGGVPPPHGTADIERTLLDAIAEIPLDPRLASLVFTWIEVHGRYVIVEKLAKLAAAWTEDERLRLAWLPAVAAWAAERGSPKWRKLARKAPEPVTLFPRDVTESAVVLKGSIPFLARKNFIVPEGSIRIRKPDVLSPAELARMNRQYRNRYLYGPSWRADIVTAIESGATSPAEIVRRLGCSYEPAHRVFREYALAAKAG